MHCGFRKCIRSRDFRLTMLCQLIHCHSSAIYPKGYLSKTHWLHFVYYCFAQWQCQHAQYLSKSLSSKPRRRASLNLVSRMLSYVDSCKAILMRSFFCRRRDKRNAFSMNFLFCYHQQLPSHSTTRIVSTFDQLTANSHLYTVLKTHRSTRMGFFKATTVQGECDKAAQILKSFIGNTPSPC